MASLSTFPKYSSHSEIGFYPGQKSQPQPQVVRSLSPEDVQKLRYKVALDKQVTEKLHHRQQERQRKLEREKQLLKHYPFGRNSQTTFVDENELQELITKGRAPSPNLDMNAPPPITSNYNANTFPSSAQSESYTQNSSTNYATNYTQPTQYQYQSNPNINGTYQPQQQQNGGTNYDFQRFYGPKNQQNTPNIQTNPTNPQQQSIPNPIKGDAHDPFLLFDPNKEGQNVFNVIPQQEMYDPWGRPGAGAPLIHSTTGQKFTRYSGSLQDKLNTREPLGFYRRVYPENIEEQKRDLELEQLRRREEDIIQKSNQDDQERRVTYHDLYVPSHWTAGDTADWINQLENYRYPLRKSLPTTDTTRENIGARRFKSDASRVLHADLVQQAEERARYQKLNKMHNNVQDLQHTESMNNWWGKGGGGAPGYTNRRHNVDQSFEKPRSSWTKDHTGRLIMTEQDPQDIVKTMPVSQTDFYYPKQKRLSNHRNNYQIYEDL